MANLSKNLTAELVTSKALKSLTGKLSLKSLVGTWKNCNSKTRGVVQVDLKTKGGKLYVRLWGACTPTPCNWGQVKGLAYAKSVTSKTAIAFTAIYKKSFKDTIVTGHLDQGTLILEVYSRFKDGSGRSNYYSKEYLCKRKSK